MTRFSSADLRTRIMEAGIAYVPADQVFYQDYPYKIELSPKFKGLGGVSGIRSCKIDIGDPIKARTKLAEFNTLMDKVISNVEYRAEIKEFVSRLPKVEYKTRMGGENNLFYFRDPEVVMLVVDRYHEVINSVTGPINTEHEGTLDEVNVIMRDRLYFNKFRYYIEFERTEEFVTKSAPQLIGYLESLDNQSWRDHKLYSIVKFHEMNGYVNSRQVPRPRLGSPMTIGGFPPINTSYSFPPRSVVIYLADPNDYVYIKLMTAEYVKKNHEVVLFDELT